MDEVSISNTPILYLAPEVMGAKNYRPHYSFPADIWGFGVLGYRLCTKDIILAGAAISESTILDQLKKITHPSVKDFLQKCLQINPRERATASDLLVHDLLTEGNSKKYSSFLLPSLAQLNFNSTQLR